MRFLLEPGDHAVARPCAPGEPGPGDLALLVKWLHGRPSGYVIHRVLVNFSLAGRQVLLTKGDANLLLDLPPSAFQPIARIVSIVRGGRIWSARPGLSWPFACAYSFAAGKILSVWVFLVFYLFAAAAFFLPRYFSGLLNALYLYWETRLYPAAVDLAARVVRPSEPGGAAPVSVVLKSGRIRADETWSGRIVVADYLVVDRGVRVSLLPGTELIFERREPGFFPVVRVGTDGQMSELESASAKILVYGSFSAQGSAKDPVIFTGPSFGGLHALGAGKIKLESCRSQRSAACVLSGRDDARIDIRSCEFVDCAGGLEVSGRASLAALNSRISGSAGHGLKITGQASAAVNGSHVRACAGPGIEVSGSSFAAFSGTDVEDCNDGISAAGEAGIFMKNCRFSGNTCHGAVLSGAAGFSAEAAVFSLNSGGVTAKVHNTVRLADCVAEENSGTGIVLESVGMPFIEAVAFSGGKPVIKDGGVIKGLLPKRRPDVFKVEIRKRGPVSLYALVPGSGPRALLLDGDSAAACRVTGINTSLPAVAADARPLARLLFRFAAATALRPGFSALYRLFYLSALPVARVLLTIPGVKALYLYRGMAAKGWVPGLSDIDLACVLNPSGPAEDYFLYSKLCSRLRLLKAVFPFMGEVMFATAGDFAAFFNCWGVKGAEFSTSSRLLSGSPVPLQLQPPAAGPGDFTEAFYAYTLLMRHFLVPGLPRAFSRRNCLKNMVDTKRYLAPPSPERVSRSAYARLLGLPLENFMSVDCGDAAYEAFLALHQSAGEFGGQIAAAGSPAAGGWFNKVCRALAEDCGLSLGVILDPLYRVYVVVPDLAAHDRQAYLRACAALCRAQAGSPLLGASPLVLTQSAFALLCGLPYLNNPVFSLDMCIDGQPSGLNPEYGGIYRYNLAYKGTVLPPAQLRDTASLAARHFCASWRSLWPGMPPHYFYTRALGLRLLLEKGLALPFSRPGGFSPVLDSIRGDTHVPSWEEYLAGGADAVNYRFIAEYTTDLGHLANAG
ncbi:MAG: hypothetical protein A2285_01675 [Elusimicrobia bacterium RIFOXYA12_FULL_57_11]|nr:MAG: hypothetical protein A2285_01675 [Elusimicrobia bacterium RIFOXYA12_FULL_57_11]